MMKRYALVATGEAASVDRYLPGNYEVLCVVQYRGRTQTVIGGRDNAGWTLDDYVLPRLASGLYFGYEIDLSHEVMKEVPDDALVS